ncbi:MAG: NAD(P)/FAD-dependent oxidoreductase [Firmicutes bacterium]|nr:NAD(P)/FAD-dependent oxidoreductase [Bacillota bacterium]
MQKVIVVGGGAAGMMAAVSAAKAGACVLLLERNNRLGWKLSITGKGRCNVTNDSTMQEIIKNIPGNGSFLYSSLAAFDSASLQDFFRAQGVELKTERGKRVFPVSDNAKDIVAALKRAMEKLGVKVLYGKYVDKLLIEDGAIQGVQAGEEVFEAERVIITCGGKSYSTTGSDGSGYMLAEQAGHSIITPKPALVPLYSEDKYIPGLAGLSLKNVEVSLYHRNKLLAAEFGEMLFTHKGVSGPVILSLSFDVCTLSAIDQRQCILKINLKPALDMDKLQARLQRDLDKFSRRHLANSLNELLPQSIIPVVIQLSGVFPHKECNQITKEERKALCEIISAFPVHISSVGTIEEAIVTAGGVCVKEINPKTMESRKVSGLYFCGEVLDVQGYTGGFNLQAAFSMGNAAGKYAAEEF